MSKKICILAINKPEIENWMHGVSREGGLAKVPIWEDLHVADILQDPKDIIPSIENNNPEIVYISNLLTNIENTKLTLRRCKQSYPKVRIILLLWASSPEHIQSSQDLIHFCLDNSIATDFVTKISIVSIKKSLDNAMSLEDAEALRDPNFVPTKPILTEQPSLPKQKVFGVAPEDQAKTEPTHIQPPTTEQPKQQVPATEQPKQQVPSVESPRQQAPIVEPPKQQVRTMEQPKQPRQVPEGEKLGQPVVEQPKQDPPKVTPRVVEYPKADNHADTSLDTAQEPKIRSLLGELNKKTKNIIKLDGTQEQEKTPPSLPSMPQSIPQLPQQTPHQGMPQFINAKVVTFYSPNSMGKTTLISNMAVQAAKIGLKTIAIDLNVFKHNLGAYFGIPRKTPGLEQLLFQGINEKSISSLLQNKCGVDILPIGMERGRYDLTVDPNQVKDLLISVTRRMGYTLILVDICNIIDEAATATVLSQSDIIYLVVDQNRSFLEDVYNDMIYAEETINIPREKFRLVINNYVGRSNMNQSRIESYLKMQAVSVIPSDRFGHLEAVNFGKPYCTTKTEDTEVWNALVSDAIGRNIVEKPNVFTKLKGIFSKN